MFLVLGIGAVYVDWFHSVSLPVSSAMLFFYLFMRIILSDDAQFNNRMKRMYDDMQLRVR